MLYLRRINFVFSKFCNRRFNPLSHFMRAFITCFDLSYSLTSFKCTLTGDFPSIFSVAPDEWRLNSHYPLLSLSTHYFISLLYICCRLGIAVVVCVLILRFLSLCRIWKRERYSSFNDLPLNESSSKIHYGTSTVLSFPLLHIIWLRLSGLSMLIQSLGLNQHPWWWVRIKKSLNLSTPICRKRILFITCTL